MRDAGDEELLEAFRAGDEQAFEILFDRFRALLAARVRERLPRAIRRRVSVDDVLQETQLAAFQARERLEAQSTDQLRNWLLSVADHKALHSVRRHGKVAKRSVGREVTRAGRPATSAFSGQQATPSQVAMAAETLELARKVRNQLSPDYAEVLRLAREEGLALREVAERMGRSYEATKKLYGRAWCRFTSLMEGGRGGADGA